MPKPTPPRRPLVRYRKSRPTITEQYPILVTPEEEQVLEAGISALATLKQTRTRDWNLWVSVGETLQILRDKVMHAVGVKEPVGASYNLLFGEWLSRLDLDTPRSTRSHLLELIQHRIEVERWRASLPAEERYRYTHPNSIWKKWKATQSNEPT